MKKIIKKNNTECKMDSPDFIANLKFKTTEDGGRKSHANSGYRPQIEFENYPERITSGTQNYIGKSKLFPGETGNAGINIVSFDYFQKRLFIGMKFIIKEGDSVIGSGKIIEIKNNDLEIVENDKTTNNLNFYPKDIIKRIETVYGGFQNEIKIKNEIQELLNLDKIYRNSRIIRATIYLFTKGKIERKEVFKMVKLDWRDILYLSEYDKKDNKIRDFNNEFGSENI